MAKEWRQGLFQPKNPEKYIGKQAPFFRSSWENKFMVYCDQNINVVKWCNECIVIPYRYELDGKVHRYFTDFFVIARTRDGKINRYVVEIKPRKHIEQPKEPKNKTKKAKLRYINEQREWVRNQNKWTYAKEYCRQHGFIFKILNQKELKINEINEINEQNDNLEE